MAKTVPMSFRLTPELKAKLQSLADADRRSLTNYIEIVLEDHAGHVTVKTDFGPVVLPRKRKPAK